MIRARETGEGAELELAQSDCAAAFDWYRSETYRAYERPESEVTGNPSDNYERRAPGTAGMKRRRALPDLREQRRTRAVHGERAGVLEELLRGRRPAWTCSRRWPGSTYADHARGNRELQAELRDHLRDEDLGGVDGLRRRVNTPIAPVNTPKTLRRRPAVRRPASTGSRRRELGADQLGFPVKFVGEELAACRTRRRRSGQHTDDVLRAVCGYDDDADRCAPRDRERSGERSASAHDPGAGGARGGDVRRRRGGRRRRPSGQLRRARAPDRGAPRRCASGAASQPGDRVGIWAPNTLDWVVAALGALSAGGVAGAAQHPVQGRGGGLDPRPQRRQALLRLAALPRQRLPRDAGRPTGRRRPRRRRCGRRASDATPPTCRAAASPASDPTTPAT